MTLPPTRPDEVRKVFGRHRTVPVGASFGVMLVTAPRSEDNVEVATFRKEGPYLDGRRPDSVQYCTPEEDARRRDFTVNGMFYDPLNDTVLDFVGGQEDLRLGIVRAIGDAHHRITEDKLRMLRAVRIAATLNFTLDPATAAAISEMAYGNRSRQRRTYRARIGTHAGLPSAGTGVGISARIGAAADDFTGDHSESERNRFRRALGQDAADVG